jgi:preprotein translocase subunit SecY
MSAFKYLQIVAGAILGVLAGWLMWQGIAPLISAMRASAGVSGNLLLSSSVNIVGGLLIVGAYYYGLIAASPVRRILENIFSIPELLRKLAFTLLLLCIYRVGFHITLPGLDEAQLRETMKAQEEPGNAFGTAIQYFGMFTGGSLSQSTLFGLGIMPYISASIIFQLLSTVLPALEKLRKEGPAGYKKIQEYTRYATVPLCLIEAIVWMRVMASQGWLYEDHAQLTYAMSVLGLTAGTMFLMWLGEQIDEYGIGNGISLLILAGIVSRLPWAVQELGKRFEFKLTGSGGGQMGFVEVALLAGMFVFVVAGAILITQGQRRIPIQQAKQMRGRRVYGGQRQYLPLRVNHGGVMPLIFASSLMIFPNVVFGWINSAWQNEYTRSLRDAFQSGNYVYELMYIGMIFFFAYFWTTVQFRPKEMSEQLRDYGTFIPGLRPGRRTAEYLERVMERITYCGAAFLSVIAVIPSIVSTQMGIPFKISAFLGGTGLLIVVSVALDLVQRIEANLVMRNYGGFLGGSTRIKGAYR